MGGAAAAWAWGVSEVEKEAYGHGAGTAHWRPSESIPDPGETPHTELASDPDILEELGDQIATLAAHGTVATHRLLTLIARFDRLRGWEAAGHRGCAEWLAWRTGMDPRTAREHVRVARSLEALPETSRSMSRGRLSFSKVRALTRVAAPDTEADLLELAEGSTAARLEVMVRAWKKGTRQDEAARAREIHRLRRLSIVPDEEGMYVIRGRLEPEIGALLMRAIDAASDALYREEPRPERRPERREDAAAVAAAVDARSSSRGSAEPRTGADANAGVAVPAGSAEPREVEWTIGREAERDTVRDTGLEAARRRADAVGLLAERALAAGLGGREGPEPPISGTRAGRYQVLLHVDPETLSADGEPGHSHLEDGTRLSAETARRLACDAAVVTVRHAGDGSVLDVGRRTRTIPPALRRALEVRDRGCRFPGCGLRFTDAHHVEHWADGGATTLDNCVLLCRYHHRLVHEDGWRLEWWGKGRAVFRDPRGRVHMDEVREEALWLAARSGGRACAVASDDPGARGESASREEPHTREKPVSREKPHTREEPVSRETPRARDESRAREDQDASGRLASLLLDEWLRANRRHGADPGPLTASARWKRERDIPDEVWFRVMEAGMQEASGERPSPTPLPRSGTGAAFRARFRR